MLSFASTVKNEVVFNEFDNCCKRALLSALIKINGTLALSNQGLSLTIRTENAKIASKVHKFLKELYNPNIEFLVSRKMKLNKNNVYIVKISKAREIIDDLHVITSDNLQYIEETLLKNECCKRAYMAGAFLACGSVNNPETSNYHLEMSFNEEDYAQFMQTQMNYFSLNAKMIQRRNKYVVYLKSSEKIGDFLRAIGASQSVMNFETTRIDRNMSNTVNRWNNCDIANEVKSMASANKQLDDINTVEMFLGLEMLDEKTRVVALIRKKYPDLTLNELCDAYYEETGQTISKSGLHHRFKKLSEEAKRLIQMERD